MSRRVFLGQKARQLRRDHGLTQLAMAKRLDISPSYLNLIEHNRRPMTPSLLRKIAEAFSIETESFSGRREARLRDELTELLGDPLFQRQRVRHIDLDEIVPGHPSFCRAMLDLYQAYRKSRSELLALTEQLSDDPVLTDSSHRLLTLLTSVRSFGEILRDNADLSETKRTEFAGILVGESEKLTAQVRDLFEFIGRGGLGPATALDLPREEVSEVLQAHNNYYQPLEEAAETFRGSLSLGPGVKIEGLLTALLDHLAEAYGVEARLLEDPRAARGLHSDGTAAASKTLDETVAEPDTSRMGQTQVAVGPRPWMFDEVDRVLLLAEPLPQSSRTFQVARALCQLAHGALLDRLVNDASLSSEKAQLLYRRSLASYFAAALMMPYDAFRTAAEALRHDLDRLSTRFSVSFEQVCHRLTSLQRPGAEGVPFHFLRSDMAGNIDKRFSASGLALPRYGGICPLWNLHAAFSHSGRISAQQATLPDGSRYLFLAGSCRKPGMSFGAEEFGYSVSIGCDISFANRIVYADGLDLSQRNAGVLVGLNCRHCPRDDCRQRAYPSLRP
jgi:predicted transcriptional regulator/transcriptional regulator with XRE-family HTH domain